MKILHLTINPIALERRILNQANSACNVGGQITVFALKSEKFIAKRDDLTFELREISTRFQKGGPLKFLHFNLKIWLAARRLDVDIIHAHDLWIFPSAAILAKSIKIPLVYDAHEFYGGLEIFTYRKIRKFIWMQVEKWCLPVADQIITVSEPLAGLYREYFQPTCPVAVIRNLPAFEEPDLTNQIPLRRESGEHLILFHGHFRPGRGLVPLVRALESVPNCRLALIGGGDLMAELEALAQQTGLRNRVDFYDYIETRNLVSTAAQADVAIVLFEATSLNYAHALPNKFFEYLMAGVPVLASNIDTFTEYINQYKVGRTVDPTRIEDITEVLNDMLSNPKRLKEWHHNALLAVRELNWENESGKLLAIYENLERK